MSFNNGEQWPNPGNKTDDGSLNDFRTVIWRSAVYGGFFENGCTGSKEL
ncbi:MAG: hypothetical protein M9911_14345 [Saprospiraceae bacterium]|nr:hypothetical protein [Saprospiraceae bacterium]